jgi:hypothetical protein
VPKPIVRYLINVFLIFHIVVITLWSLPISSPLMPPFRDLVRPYLVAIGLFQSWDTFAPSPRSGNQYLEAMIIYKDGSSRLWPFPRMELLSLTERYAKERYRKYAENLQNGQYAELRPDAARYIARLHSSPSNPAQTVMLIVRWSDILPDAPEGHDRGPGQMNVFYTYAVKPEDLQ